MVKIREFLFSSSLEIFLGDRTFIRVWSSFTWSPDLRGVILIFFLLHTSRISIRSVFDALDGGK